MNTEHIKLIIESISFKGFNCELYHGNNDDWNSVVNNANLASAIYNWSNIEYQTQYFSEIAQYEAFPIIIYSRGKAVTVFPLAVQIIEGITNIVTNGGPVYEPLLVDSLATREVKSVTDICFNILNSIRDTLDVNNVNFKLISRDGGLSNWGTKLISCSKVDSVSQLLSIDTYKSLDEIKSKFRKSYKPLINKGLKQWTVDIIESKNSDVFWEYKNLHKEVAGRDTRSSKTWELQLNMLEKREAFLVTLRDEELNLVGGGFFTFNKSSAMYATGAYRRELFSEPLGHVVQFKAIEYMKYLNISRYEIGEDKSKLYGATDKECTISEFKAGFCTRKDMVIILNLKTN